MSYKGALRAKTSYQQDIRTYRTSRDDMSVINAVVIKGKHVVIPEALQQKVLKQLHINHMGIKKQHSWQTNLFIR